MPGEARAGLSDDELLRKLAMENYSSVHIAIELKRSVPAVKSRARSLGIPLGTFSPRSHADLRGFARSDEGLRSSPCRASGRDRQRSS